MSEWWTYTLSDFLLFSPRTYYRLFEIYNAAIWPAQIAAILLGLVLLALVRRARGSPPAGRWAAALLASSWVWIGIAFHARRYFTINWAALYFGGAFVLEAALLTWIGTVRGSLRFEPEGASPNRAGLWLFVFALLIEPLMGPLLGRGWRSVEVFGAAPDPTAVGTLGLLLLAGGRGRGWLMLVPTLWCAVTGATLLAMKAPDAFIAPLAAALALFVVFRDRRRQAGAMPLPVRRGAAGGVSPPDARGSAAP